MGFKRYDGFYGSVPQGFINNNFKSKKPILWKL